MFYDILDKKRQNILLILKNFKKDFYLAGGTALALQIGHRDSMDFDFFTNKDIDTQYFFKQIKQLFNGYKILKIQEEKNTLTILIDNSVKLSFFTYNYILIDKLIEDDNLRLASVLDIGCMKLSSIVSRATNKDYIDLYFILQKINLETLLEKAKKKFPDLDKNLILKSLVYFDDIEKEPIMFKNRNKLSQKEIEDFFNKEVKKII